LVDKQPVENALHGHAPLSCITTQGRIEERRRPSVFEGTAVVAAVWPNRGRMMPTAIHTLNCHPRPCAEDPVLRAGEAQWHMLCSGSCSQSRQSRSSP